MYSRFSIPTVEVVEKKIAIWNVAFVMWSKRINKKNTPQVRILGTANKVGKITKDIANKSKDLVVNSTNSVINAIDQNGNGEIDIEDIVIMGLRVPGIKINRAEFLKRELFKIIHRTLLTLQ